MKTLRNQPEGVVDFSPAEAAAVRSQKVSPRDEGLSMGSRSHAVGNTELCQGGGLPARPTRGPLPRIPCLSLVCLFDLLKKRGVRKYFLRMAEKT